MEHLGETVTAVVEYELEEYKQIVQEFGPQYLEARHKNRNPYFPWNWAISEKAMMALLVPLIFKWKISKVGVCEFTFSEVGFTRSSKSGSVFRSWEQVFKVYHLSSAYLIALAEGGAMPVPYRVLTNEQRTLLETFAKQVPYKILNPDVSKAGPD